MIIELKMRSGYSFEALVSARFAQGEMRYKAELAETGTMSLVNLRDECEGASIEEALAVLAKKLSDGLDQLHAT